MKTKIYLTALFLISTLSINSQTFTSLQNVIHKGISASMGNTTIEFSNKIDLDNNGTVGLIKGIMIKKISDNIFWISNGQILNSDNEAIIDFGKKIFVNGKYLTPQVPSFNGYVIEIPKDKKGELLVSMADEKGNKNSDELLINLDIK